MPNLQRFFLLWLLALGSQVSLPGQPNPALAPVSFTSLLKDSRLQQQFRLSPEGLGIYAPEADTAELHLSWADLPYWRAALATWPDEALLRAYEQGNRRPAEVPLAVASLRRPDSLPGLRVAIDPGHIAGDSAVAWLEGKFIRMHPTASRPAIQFFEAQLTLATAWLIRDSLEALGAEVLLTREQAGVGALGLSYWDWKKQRWPRLLDSLVAAGDLTAAQARQWRARSGSDADKLIMDRFFIPEDLRARARKVNAFRPDLTLIIHYNVDFDNWQRRDSASYLPPGQENYCMAFVPGAFMQGELAKPVDRLALLRLLLTRDLNESERLAAAFVAESERLTGVPAVSPAAGIRYLERACIPAGSPGVFHRNLSLTRLIRGPLVYGESLCQDHWQESLWLNQRDLPVGGGWAAERVRAVAAAYVGSVLLWVGGKD